MFTGKLKVGDRLIWRHFYPPAFAPLVVEQIEEFHNIGNDVRLTDGRDWHCLIPENAVRRSCMRHPRGAWGYVDVRTMSISQLETEWHKQMKTAAQQSQAAAENPDREPTGQD